METNRDGVPFPKEHSERDPSQRLQQSVVGGSAAVEEPSPRCWDESVAVERCCRLRGFVGRLSMNCSSDCKNKDFRLSGHFQRQRLVEFSQGWWGAGGQCWWSARVGNEFPPV